jgi:hypothetical protein
MSVVAYDPREALFVFCLLSSVFCLLSSSSVFCLAVLCLRRRQSKNGSPTKNPISIGSIVPGIHPIPILTASIKVLHGSPRKSNWTIAERWFSNTADKQEGHPPQSRRQKEFWQSGPENCAHVE